MQVIFTFRRKKKQNYASLILIITFGISGLDRFEARKKLWSELEETGLAVKKEPYTLRVPRSQRGGEVCYP